MCTALAPPAQCASAADPPDTARRASCADPLSGACAPADAGRNGAGLEGLSAERGAAPATPLPPQPAVAGEESVVQRRGAAAAAAGGAGGNVLSGLPAAFSTATGMPSRLASDARGRTRSASVWLSRVERNACVASSNNPFRRHTGLITQPPPSLPRHSTTPSPLSI